MPASRKIKKVYYHKLIRDRVPQTMQAKGKKFSVRTLTKAAFRRELLLKVGEEASALPALNTADAIASEMGDVLDVLDAIQKEFRISSVLLRKHRAQAMKRKGGFRKRVYLIWAQRDEYKTNERRSRR